MQTPRRSPISLRTIGLVGMLVGALAVAQTGCLEMDEWPDEVGSAALASSGSGSGSGDERQCEGNTSIGRADCCSSLLADALADAKATGTLIVSNLGVTNAPEKGVKSEYSEDGGECFAAKYWAHKRSGTDIGQGVYLGFNRGGMVPDGPLASTDNDSAENFANLLEWAYRQDCKASGGSINKVVVLSHSNGALTTSRGYEKFFERLRKGDIPPRHCTCPRFEVDLDFVQTAFGRPHQHIGWNSKWGPVQKRQLRNPQVHAENQKIDLCQNFYYNSTDWMTYSGASTVGRSWSNMYVNGVKNRDPSACVSMKAVNDHGTGPGHDQVEAPQWDGFF